MRPQDASFKLDSFDRDYRGKDINDLAVTVSNNYICIYTRSTIAICGKTFGILDKAFKKIVVHMRTQGIYYAL